MSDTVYDGHAEWRIVIETKTNWRGRRVWRWRLDRKFVSWDYGWRRGLWRTTEEKARARGEKVLAKKNPHRLEAAR